MEFLDLYANSRRVKQIIVELLRGEVDNLSYCWIEPNYNNKMVTLQDVTQQSVILFRYLFLMYILGVPF